MRLISIIFIQILNNPPVFSYPIWYKNIWKKEILKPMAIGYLLIQARTAHDALPLSGVQVRISDMNSNVLYVLTTDENRPPTITDCLS